MLRNIVSTIEPMQKIILAHPFVQELGLGILCRKKFRGFMQQDILYLNSFFEAMHKAAERMPNRNHSQQLKEIVASMIDSERRTNTQYLKEHTPRFYPPLRVDAVKSPVISQYTSYLDASQTETAEVTLAALFPCFHIYYNMGKILSKHAHAAHPFQSFIESCCSKDYELAVKAIHQITEEAGSIAPLLVRKKMISASKVSARHELMFLNESYADKREPSFGCNESSEKRGVLLRN
jgi:thiaminase